MLSFSDRLEHTEPLFIRLDLLPFNKLIHHRIGLFMYTVYKDMYPTIITNMYLHNQNIYSHNTRQKHHFHLAMVYSITFMPQVSIALAFWFGMIFWKILTFRCHSTDSNVHWNITYNTIIYPRVILNVFIYFLLLFFLKTLHV